MKTKWAVVLMVSVVGLVELSQQFGWSQSLFMAVLVGYSIVIFAVLTYLQTRPETGFRSLPVWKTAPNRTPWALWRELRRRHLYGEHVIEIGLVTIIVLVISLQVTRIVPSLPILDWGGPLVVGWLALAAVVYLGYTRHRFITHEVAQLDIPGYAIGLVNDLEHRYQQGERLSGAVALMALANFRLERYGAAERFAQEALVIARRQYMSAKFEKLDNPVAIAQFVLKEIRQRTEDSV